MSEIIYITTEQNQNKASTLAQQYNGVVVVLCPVFIDQDGSLSTTKSDSTVNETQGLKLSEWYSDNDYIDSETEKTFSTNRMMVKSDTFVISGSFDSDVEILNKDTNDIWLVDEMGAKFYLKNN